MPNELSPSRITLTESDEATILLCTGFVGRRVNLRLWRFALRMQQAFPGRVRAWLVNSLEHGFDLHTSVEPFTKGEIRKRDYFLRVARLILSSDWQRWQRLPSRFGQGISNRLRILRQKRREVAVKCAEARLFSEEIQQLRREIRSPVLPISVAELGGWRSPQTVAAIKQLNPYIIASFECGPLPEEILACARGISVSQQSGWFPGPNGNHMIERALYHRSIDLIGATVHVTTSGVEAGGILRRSWLALNDHDDAGTIFCRAAGLGTELMLDVIEEILQRKTILVFSPGTYMNRQIDLAYTDSMDARVLADERTGWLHEALEVTRSF